MPHLDTIYISSNFICDDIIFNVITSLNNINSINYNPKQLLLYNNSIENKQSNFLKDLENFNVNVNYDISTKTNDFLLIKTFDGHEDYVLSLIEFRNNNIVS